MKLNKIKESGIYLVIGPPECVSLLPTENILFLYPNGDLVMEGNNYMDCLNDGEDEIIEVICLAKSENHPSLREGVFDE
jgi:hypothetical protein